MSNGLMDTIPADTDRPCDCCGRTHRKLKLINGYWLGATCADAVAFYHRSAQSAQFTADPEATMGSLWEGRERRLSQIKRMLCGSGAP
jgi:hypothetical protein